jgi:hypothetical protein
VWSSVDEAKRFLSDTFAPALRAAGFEGQPPTAEFWPLLVHEAASQDTFDADASPPRAASAGM